MITSRSLQFMEDDEGSGPTLEGLAISEAPAPAEPNVFVRTISTPPGLPWEQGRVADLEARHGSPLPIAEVLYRLRRLDGWRPGAAGRFAAFYVLGVDVQERLDANAEVDGRTVAVTFVTGGAKVAQTGRAALRAVAVAALVVLVVWSLAVGLGRRSETAATLQLVEQRTAAKLRRAEAARRRQDLDRLFALQLDRGERLSDVLGDLAWLSNAKTPEARIESVHWEPGFMAVAARGEASPLLPAADRDVRRATKPLRAGVWLWGVTEPHAETTPVAAEMGP